MGAPPPWPDGRQQWAAAAGQAGSVAQARLGGTPGCPPLHLCSPLQPSQAWQRAAHPRPRRWTRQSSCWAGIRTQMESCAAPPCSCRPRWGSPAGCARSRAMERGHGGAVVQLRLTSAARQTTVRPVHVQQTQPWPSLRTAAAPAGPCAAAWAAAPAGVPRHGWWLSRGSICAGGWGSRCLLCVVKTRGAPAAALPALLQPKHACRALQGHSEPPAAGAAAGPPSDPYILRHWRCLDTFAYFSHRLVTIPPPGFVAHLRAWQRAACATAAVGRAAAGLPGRPGTAQPPWIHAPPTDPCVLPTTCPQLGQRSAHAWRAGARHSDHRMGRGRRRLPHPLWHARGRRGGSSGADGHCGAPWV